MNSLLENVNLIELTDEEMFSVNGGLSDLQVSAHQAGSNLGGSVSMPGYVIFGGGRCGC